MNNYSYRRNNNNNNNYEMKSYKSFRRRLSGSFMCAVMGGILFFRSGFRMSEAKIGRSRTTPMEREESQESDDLAISPIGIPLIAGPGAITAAMLLSSQIPQLYSYATLGISILLVLGVVYLILRNGDLLVKALGYTGMRVIQRLMGLVLMVIAVQFVINGVMSILSPLFTASL